MNAFQIEVTKKLIDIAEGAIQCCIEDLNQSRSDDLEFIEQAKELLNNQEEETVRYVIMEKDYHTNEYDLIASGLLFRELESRLNKLVESNNSLKNYTIYREVSLNIKTKIEIEVNEEGNI